MFKYSNYKFNVMYIWALFTILGRQQYIGLIIGRFISSVISNKNVFVNVVIKSPVKAYLVKSFRQALCAMSLPFSEEKLLVVTSSLKAGQGPCSWDLRSGGYTDTQCTQLLRKLKYLYQKIVYLSMIGI